MSLLRLLDLGVEQAEQRGVSVHGRAELQIAIGPLSFSSHPGRRGRQWNKFHPSPSSRYFTSNHSGRSICHPQASLAPLFPWIFCDTAKIQQGGALWFGSGLSPSGSWVGSLIPSVDKWWDLGDRA